MTTGRRAALWAPVLLYMAVIFAASAQPQAPLPPQISDKQGHSFGYMGLAVVVTRALAGGLPARIAGGTAALAFGLTTAYGVSDEWHQSFVPGRSSDINDVYADAFGAVLGTVACWAWGIIRPRADA